MTSEIERRPATVGRGAGRPVVAWHLLKKSSWEKFSTLKEEQLRELKKSSWEKFSPLKEEQLRELKKSTWEKFYRLPCPFQLGLRQHACVYTLLVGVVARTRMLANKTHPQSSQLIITLCSREMRKSIMKSIEKSITKSITKSIEKSITKSIEKSPTMLKNHLSC